MKEKMHKLNEISDRYSRYIEGILTVHGHGETTIKMVRHHVITSFVDGYIRALDDLGIEQEECDAGKSASQQIGTAT